MTNANRPHDDLTTYIRRAHVERAQAVAALVDATVRQVHGWAAGIAAARARRRLRRETVKHLATLNDRILWDIGIPRGTIWAVADDLASAAVGTAVREREPARPARAPANQNQAHVQRLTAVPLAVGCG